MNTHKPGQFTPTGPRNGRTKGHRSAHRAAQWTPTRPHSAEQWTLKGSHRASKGLTRPLRNAEERTGSHWSHSLHKRHQEIQEIRTLMSYRNCQSFLNFFLPLIFFFLGTNAIELLFSNFFNFFCLWDLEIGNEIFTEKFYSLCKLISFLSKCSKFFSNFLPLKFCTPNLYTFKVESQQVFPTWGRCTIPGFVHTGLVSLNVRPLSKSRHEG